MNKTIINLLNINYISYFALVLFIITFIVFLITFFITRKNIFNSKKIFEINKENKIKKIRKKNNLITIFSLLISILIMTLINSYLNIKENNINNYLNNNGISDLIILRQDSDDNLLNQKIENYQKTNAQIDSSKLTFSSDNNIFETNVIYGDIKEINTFCGLDFKLASSNQIVVNDYFLNQFNLKINNEITIDNKSFVIAKNLSKFDYVFNNSPLILIDSQSIDVSKKNIYGEIIFLYLNHNSKLVKNISSYLDENKYSYIDMYSDYNYVVSQTDTLKTFTIFIIIFISLIGIMILYYLINTNLKTSKYFWNCLYNIGLSKKEIFKTQLLKISKLLVFNLFYGLLGGTLITYILSIIRKETFYLSSIPNTLYLIVPITILFFGFIFTLFSFISINKKQDNLNVKNKISQPLLQNIFTCSFLIVGLALLLISIFVFNSNYFISLILNTACSILFFIFVFRILFINIIPKIKYKNIHLLKYSSKLFSKPTLILSSIILFTFFFISSGFNLVSSSEKFAFNKANNEYYYSYRLTTKNDTLGKSEINNIISSSETKIINKYYAISGQINSTSYNIFATDGISQVEKTYDIDINFNSIKENEIVLNTYGIGNSSYKVGDKINVTLLGNKKEFSIIGLINSLDYHGRAAFISPSYYQESSFNTIIVEGNILSSEESFKSIFSSSIINYRNRDELIHNQVENIISGMESIESVLIIIASSLLLILYFSINQSLVDKKRLFSVIRTFGISKKNCSFLLTLEWLILSLALTLLFSAFSPIIATSFISFSTFSSLGEIIPFTFDPLIYFVLGAIIFVLPIIVSIKSSVEVSNVDMIYEVKNII